MNKKPLVLLIVPIIITMIVGCSFGDLGGGEPTSTPTPTKTFVPTFTATPTIIPSPTNTPAPTETPLPTTPPEAPTPTEAPTSTPAPPANTPTPRPPAPTPTPRPPAPTNTPQPAYEYYYIMGSINKDFCHAGFCLPEIAGEVRDAQGNPVPRYSVWIKLESTRFGVEYCAVGDEHKMLQPGQFKFESHGGERFGDYTLTVVRSQGDPTPLSASLEEKMRSAKSQQTGIIFQKY